MIAARCPVKRRLELVVIAAVLVGCAGNPPSSDPRPRQREAAAPASVATVTSAALTSPRPEPLIDLTVDQAIRLADMFHPYLASAHAEVEAAEGRTVQAGLFPGTAAIFRMEGGRLNNGNTVREADYLAGVLQVLPISGRLGASERVEQHDRERLLHEAGARQLGVHSRIRGAFATALFFQRVKRAYLTAADHADRAVAVARARAKSGDAPPDELARAEIEATKARIDAERAGSESDQAVFDLSAAIGAPDLRVESLSGTLDEAFDVPGIEALTQRLEEHVAAHAA
jgi:outer membrane protein TolC